MNRRFGAVAIFLVALTALAGVLSFLFFSQQVPKNSSAAQPTSIGDSTSTSTSTKSASPLPSPSPDGQSSAANLPDQPQGSSAQGQNSSTNRVTKNTAPASTPRRTIADILEGVDLSKPGERERVVAEMKAIEDQRLAEAIARAKDLGMPLRIVRPDGSISEIAGIDENGQVLYRTTHNLNAAISTAVNLIQSPPYNLNGTNILVGVWDGGAARPTHQEFGGRVTVRDGAANDDHATHVAGTIIASGVTAAAKGMATAARIDSYEWTSDFSEMTSAGAAVATATNKMLISNHSYGYLSGWEYVNGGTPYRLWTYYGDGNTTNGYEYDFGRYNTTARDTDAVIISAPFLTTFWSAGNHRTDNPAAGASVTLSSSSTTVVSYNSGTHPPGDGVYRNGYEIIGFNGVAKNIITVGSVNDAVTNGNRDKAKATQSSFSSWGPTDDGRIKPDIVANGEGLYSSSSSSDSGYTTKNGTSMASPNAAGSAALVVQEFIHQFGVAARASTIKGLLIHTADDIGTVGPDYQNGWGLINAKAAVDLVRDDAASPAKLRLSENLLTNGGTTTHTFTWDGVSPIRATICWTDPAGTTTTNDDRTRRLVNNLDLRIVGPNGVTNRPYVMPFVGNWTTNTMSQAAVTGTNNTDNVEQVYIASPSTGGVYQAIVSHQGTLSGGSQSYSLLISGSAMTYQEETTSISPTSAFAVAGVTIDVSGRPGFRDTPDNYTSWTDSSTGGNGFGAWTLSALGNAGLFLANNPTNMNVGSTKGFGLFANSGGIATASRSFNNALASGDTVKLRFDNNWVDNGAQVGFSLADHTGTPRLRFYFVGGEEFYRVTDSVTGRVSTIPYTDSGLTVYITLGDGGAYTLIAGGSSVSGTLGPGNAITQLIVQNSNGGANTERNLYLGEVTVTGDPLSTATNLRLVRTGQNDITAGSLQMLSGVLRSTFNLSGASSGLWSVVATNVDGSILRFEDAFSVNPALYGESFDGTVEGWASASPTGSNSWSLSTAQSQTPSRSYFVAAPASKTTTQLISPSISVPADAANMQLRFWHSYNLENNQDGGRLEISIDGGTNWFTVESSGAGVSFASNGYTGTISSSGQLPSRSEFAGLSAWTGNSGGFIETVLNITDNAKFAGKTVRIRWILATNGNGASTGWYVDSVVLTGIVAPNATPPQISSAATSSASEEEVDGAVTYKVVRGTQTTMTVSATDSGGEANLIYTWSAAGGSVSFSPNGNNAAKASVATFSSAGDHTLTVTVTDGDGLFTSSSVPVRVKQTATTIGLNPMSASVVYGESMLITALQSDQFGDAMLAQPPFNWSVSAGGTINNGLFTASQTGGPYIVTATDGALSGTAQISVTQAAQAITFSNLPTKTYGDAPFAAGATASSGLEIFYTSSNTNVATVSGGTLNIVGAGETQITATQNGNANYEAAEPVAQALNVAKASAIVSLSNLSHTYDGSAKSATASTTPSGLTVDLTYNGSATSPTNAGDYAVVGSISDNNYQGSATNTLTISKASQTITFSTPSTARVGEIRNLSATATPSSLPVSVSSSDLTIASVVASNVTFQAPGRVTLTASQPGNTNFLTASNVAVEVTVSGISSPSADNNGDGIPNLLEYALATNVSGSVLPILSPPTNGTLTLTALVRTNDPGLSYTAHGVTNLLEYTNTNSVSSIMGTPSPDTNNVPDGFQKQEFRYTNNASRAFLKLTIEQQ